MEAIDQQHLQPLALHPFQRSAISSLPDVFDKRVAARVHDPTKSGLSLLANGNILFDVDVSLRLQKRFGGRERRRKSR